MGNQATVIIRTDGIDEIKRNAQEFVDKLHAAITVGAYEVQTMKGLDIGCGCHANPARVVEFHHCDSTVIIAAGGATARVVGHLYNWRWKDDAELKAAIVRELIKDEINPHAVVPVEAQEAMVKVIAWKDRAVADTAEPLRDRSKPHWKRVCIWQRS